ncbi:MAG: glycine cleavage system aminomethyltransferase GcvT [Pseudomonadota bacterium]
MGKRTFLYEQHIAADAKIVDFGGWDMPLHYGSQLKEHEQVRQDAGVFDVSHMCAVDIVGAQSRDFLRYLVANDVARIPAGKALYTCMLNEKGGILDDLIVYHRAENSYRLVVNAGTQETDIAWMQQQASNFSVDNTPRSDLAILAVQGPQARTKTLALLPTDLQGGATKLKNFRACENESWFVARTGYTGEDGLEIMLPGEQAEAMWNSLCRAGVNPIGLGARDTLRLEAGMCLYGSDMSSLLTPYESNLGWTVSWHDETRDFIGRTTLLEQRENGTETFLTGLVLEGKGVLRGHQQVLQGDQVCGEITSGTFSPTMKNAIALARLKTGVGDEVSVEIRNKFLPAKVVNPPFVRHGRALIEV